MTKVLINAVSAATGGGSTYLNAILKQINGDKGVSYVICVSPKVNINIRRISDNVELILAPGVFCHNIFFRALWEQIGVRRLIKRKKCNVLFSSGNFGLLFSPIPQILYNRNALYYSRHYYHDLLERKHYWQWVITQFKKFWNI